MKIKRRPDVDVIKSLLGYNKSTGTLIWLVSRGPVKSGDIAGTMSPQGYIVVRIDRANFMAHQIAWVIETGAWPLETIDHIDGDPSNNRFSNLRQATLAENQQNLKIYKNNTNGFPGIYFSKKDKLWKARVQVRGKRMFIGCFKNPEDAYAAYLSGKAKHHEFNPVPRWHNAANGVRA
jgi:hypothetical protein